MIGLLIICVVLIGVVGFGIWRKSINHYSWRRVLLMASIPFFGVLLGMLPFGVLSTQEVAGSTDVLFVVDLTYSMNARDATYEGRQLSRLDHVQEHIQDISQTLVGSRVAILAIDNSTTLYLPMTTSERDVRIAAETLFTKSASQSVVPPSMTAGIDEARSYLERQREVDDTRRQIVVFMTDGEVNSTEDDNDSVANAFSNLAKDTQGSLVIGYGNTTGTTIPTLRYDSIELEVVDSGFKVYDPEGKGDAITKRNDELLDRIGELANVEYVAANDSPDISVLAESLRTSAGAQRLNNGTTRALNQNVLHVPYALGALVLVSALEIWRVPALRNVLAKPWRRDS